MPPLNVSLSEWVVTAFGAFAQEYKRLEAFYLGNHKVELTDRLKEFLKVESNQFNTNFCEVIVDSMVSRLSVMGFEPLDEAAQDTALADWISGIWEANRMDLEQKLVHSSAAIKGDSYLIVDWNPDANQVDMVCNDPALIRPRYDPGNRRKLLYVAKQWVTDDTTMLNLYYPDRIEKYIGDGNVAGAALSERMDEGDEVWPTPWLNDGEPIGIPVIHFANKPGQYNHGRSELANAAPLQNALNKTLADAILVADTLGFQQRFTINARKPPGGFKIYPGAVWNIVAETAGITPTVGQFPPSDPTGIMKQMEGLVNHMAAVTMTPQHLFKLTDNFPSGEALKTAEQSLVSKIRDRQVTHGTAWENAIYMARNVQEAFGESVPSGAISTLWDDPETRNELNHLQSLEVKLNLGVPQRQIFRELGYTEEQIEQMEKDKQDEVDAEAELGGRLLRDFAAGPVG